MALNYMSLFPGFGVNELRDRRGRRWAELVDTLSELPSTDPRVMAFSLTLRRLSRHLGPGHHLCDDPLCAVCASRIVANYEGEESDLLAMYQGNLRAIERCLETRSIRDRILRKVEAIA
jgi:hypothetical protein